MSVEALTQFGQKVAQDPALQAEAQETLGIPLNELMSMNAEQLQTANTDYPALVVNLADKYGYHFTKEELLEQITIVMNPNAQGELSDEALEAVAGGGKGSNIGAAVGGVLGGVAGGFATGAPTFGTAAAGGAVLGSMGGASAGGWIGDQIQNAGW
ncbi:hypothetical protein [Iningainema tapete]|uniref:Nif11 domain-containing protein n=1 Tax=Iningainema tapete BLCC-T55 TaxID=2748662 RepID=A0A8J6XM17_9CYAN|nr:hypothetical protein [Iningainema tapete]MBD2774169.1 hypothetical protein [Iningainema tapete BLCC-T55]